MTKQPILINGRWDNEPSPLTFTPVNPSTGESFSDQYPISTLDTLKKMADYASGAAETLNHCSPDLIARFLESHAANIDQRRNEIAQVAHLETGLPYQPRLHETEMNRTIDQLRRTADCVRSRDWMTARIDTRLNLRSMYEPLGGAVLIIGPNNFPLAYNAIAGGDFAAAIAAGNPVIAKAHPLHPVTTRLLAECAHDAVLTLGLPGSTVQMFYQCEPDDGLAMIKLPQISSVGFTGSQRVGLELKRAADETGTPIYLELSSINPIFLLPAALEERCVEIANMIADSMLAGSGQQCTCPGMIVIPAGDLALAFSEQLSKRLSEAPPQVMLSADGVQGLHDSVQHLLHHGAEQLVGGHPISDAHAKYANTLLRIDASRYLQQPATMQREMFGVAAFIVVCQHDEQMIDIARTLEGNLTGTIHQGKNGQDKEQSARLTRALRPRVGRLIHNGVPTGVSVNPATVHGGPFPATGHPGFTAVGMPTSIHRFAALRCYDRVREGSLPPELRDANPTGTMRRFVDGEWTTGDAMPN